MRNSLGGLSALVLGSTIALTGCDSNHDYVKTSQSEILREEAVVLQTIYMPSRHGRGSDIAPTLTISSEGNLGFGASSVNVDVKIPEKYAIVFKCQHGKFVIESEGNKYKQLWERLNENDLVDVSYLEVYKDTYQHVKGTKKEEDKLIKRELIDYDFLNAEVKK